jgi:hypothetical protein
MVSSTIPFDTNLAYSWPKTMYTNQGRQMGERLWEETLEELRFAGVKEKLEQRP